MLLGCIFASHTGVSKSDFVRAGEPLAGQIAPAPTASADTTRRWDGDAWVPIHRTDGVQMAYLFYPEARGNQNGVVIRLRNTNAHPVCYQFTVIFRGPDTEREAHVQGTVPPNTLRTGESAGLFWTPFEDDERIGEIGVRGLRIRAECR